MATATTNDISFQSYRSHVAVLSRKHGATLPSEYLEILSSLNEKIWLDSTYMPRTKRRLINVLIEMLEVSCNSPESHDVFRLVVQDIAKIINRKSSLIITPGHWNESDGYDSLAAKFIHLKETAVGQGRVHSFDQLLKDLDERRERTVPFLYGDYLGCIMDLIDHGGLKYPGEAGPSLFRCVWAQSWNSFRQRKADLFERCPATTVEDVTNRVIHNSTLVELLDPVREQVWHFDDKEGRAYELRWRIVNSLDPVNLGLQDWPHTRGVQGMRFLPIPFNRIVLAENRDEQLKHLARLIDLLIKVRTKSSERAELEKARFAKAPAESQHALAPFTAVSRRSSKRQAIRSL